MISTGPGGILVPNLHDWTQTGTVLARLAAKYGYERIGHPARRLPTGRLVAFITLSLSLWN